jgi:hypothetical protein
LEDDDLKERYKYVTDNEIDFCGVLILSKYPCWFYERILPTQEGSSLLFAEPINGINGQPVVIAMAHFAPTGIKF